MEELHIFVMLTKMRSLQKLLGGSSGSSSFPLSNGNFWDAYYLEGNKLGSGAFSIVFDAIHRKTGRCFAVKIIHQKQFADSDEAQVRLKEEISILRKLDHPNIIKLYDVYAEHKSYLLVMEKMMPGDLLDRIVDGKANNYNEKYVRDVFAPLLNAVQYLHDNRIAHRDLKPSNLLLLRQDNDTEVKLADFGFAKKSQGPNSLSTMCGTTFFMAPEIYQEALSYGLEVDLWSVGVTLFLLLGGYLPFAERTESARRAKICAGDYRFSSKYWGHVSEEAKDLISRFLEVDRRNRLTARQALAHPWFEKEKLEENALTVNLKALQKYHSKRKVKASPWAVTGSSEFFMLKGSSEFMAPPPTAPPRDGKASTINSFSPAAA